MIKVLYALIGMVLFSLAAVAQTSLGNTRWELAELNGKMTADSKAYIEFNESEKRIVGSTGCNRMFGSYELADGAFKLSGAGTTKMACKLGVMETEAAFLKALGEATKITQIDDTLQLNIDDKVVAKFREGASKTTPNALDLTSKKWMLRSIGGKTVTLSKDAPFLNFDAEKKSAGGNGGCNVFGGSYEVNGSDIKFSDIISTLMACEDEDRGSIERQFFDGLQNANRFEIKNGKLFIYKGSDMLLEFEGTAK